MRLLLSLLCAAAWAAPQQPPEAQFPRFNLRPAALQTEALLRPESVGGLFDEGKAACGAGDWRRCADSMMKVLFLNPHHMQARSYLQASADALKKDRIKNLAKMREETLAAIGPGLEAGRIKTERWNVLLAWAQAACADRRWLSARDFYQLVLEENPLHAGAVEGLSRVRREIAARLDRKEARLSPRPAAPETEVLLRPESLGGLFDEGKAACGAGDWRRCADSMMEVLFLNHHHMQARSYLQASVNALKKERARNLRKMKEETRAAIGPGLEAGRIKTERWNALLAWAQAACADRRWLSAWDFYQRVLEENPMHRGAVEGLGRARAEIAARLDRKDFRSEGEARLYIAAHFYSLISPQDENNGKSARRAFLEALLSPRRPSELPEEVIRHYLALLGKYRPQPPKEPELAKAPPVAAKPPSDMRMILQRRAKRLFQLAARLRKEGRLQESVAAFHELIELDQRYPGAEEGFFQATQALERRKQQLRQEAESLYQAGLAYYAAGDLEKARQEMGKAVQADPDHPYARNALEALRDRGAKHLFELASRLRKDGRLAESIDAYNELLELDPRYPGAKEGYFEATHALGQRDQQRREEAESRYQAGLAYYATGNMARARDEMEKAVQADPDHSYARSALERLQRPESRAP